MKLFGYTYRAKKVRSDTDCFDDIRAQTKNPTNYKVSVCVTNLVNPKDIVDVINKTQFDYDTLTLKGHTSNAVKEVFGTYTLDDVEIFKANVLNEDIRQKIMEELQETLGDVGRKIKVLSVSIKKKEVEDKNAANQLGQAALVARQTRTDELSAELKKAQFETEKIRKRGESERSEIAQMQKNKEQLERVQAENKKTELINVQKLRNAENAKQIAVIKKEVEKETLERIAKLYEEFPAYAKHIRSIAYNEALGTNAKYFLADGMNEQMQNSLTGVESSWLFGGSSIDSEGNKLSSSSAREGVCQGNSCPAQ
jgi:regulator of protease activity HflC (stomatin/prohibitin superfamily)